MNITQVIGIEEALRLVCLELERFAAPNKLPQHTGKYANLKVLGNVEVWFSPEEVGVARFHCVTWDNVEIDVKVDFGELSRAYLDELTHMVEEGVNSHRASRSPSAVLAILEGKQAENAVEKPKALDLSSSLRNVVGDAVKHETRH